jgi:hypothetical protein
LSLLRLGVLLLLMRVRERPSHSPFGCILPLPRTLVFGNRPSGMELVG